MFLPFLSFLRLCNLRSPSSSLSIPSLAFVLALLLSTPSLNHLLFFIKPSSLFFISPLLNLTLPSFPLHFPFIFLPLSASLHLLTLLYLSLSLRHSLFTIPPSFFLYSQPFSAHPAFRQSLSLLFLTFPPSFPPSLTFQWAP